MPMFHNFLLPKYIKIIYHRIIENLQWRFKKIKHNFNRKLGFPFLQNPKSYEDLTPKIVKDTTYIEAIVGLYKIVI